MPTRGTSSAGASCTPSRCSFYAPRTVMCRRRWTLRVSPAQRHFGISAGRAEHISDRLAIEAPCAPVRVEARPGGAGALGPWGGDSRRIGGVDRFRAENAIVWRQLPGVRSSDKTDTRQPSTLAIMICAAARRAIWCCRSHYRTPGRTRRTRRPADHRIRGRCATSSAMQWRRSSGALIGR